MNDTPSVLVVDDQPATRDGLHKLLAEEGYQVHEAGDGEEALAALDTFHPDAVLCDVHMPRMDGLTLLKRAKESACRALFVMMTSSAQAEIAVEAMRSGAEHYFIKPLDVDALLAFLRGALASRTSLVDAARAENATPLELIIGETQEMRAAVEVARLAAPSTATVLVLGEAGTGKSLIARALHEDSPRRGQPFIRVSCAATSETLLESELFGHERNAFLGAVSRKEGAFELAAGGTIFLDHVAEIGPETQARLLRILQRHELERLGGTQSIPVHARVVAASSRDLAAEVKAGRFREELYHRLNVVAVTLPPLRQRKTDIPALAAHFVAKHARAYEKQVDTLAPDALEALLLCDWPGNVRELESALERAVVLCKSNAIHAADLPPLPAPAAAEVPPPPVRMVIPPAASLHEIEREAILRALDAAHGSTSRAAALLGISVRKIQYRLKEYAADPHAAPDPLSRAAR